MRLPTHAKGSEKHREQPVYRWDLGDIMQYYRLTGDLLCNVDVPWPLCFDVLLYDWTGLDILVYINLYYNNIVGCLRKASCDSILKKKHSYQKYWWDEELTLLKQKAIQSFNIWS